MQPLMLKIQRRFDNEIRIRKQFEIVNNNFICRKNKLEQQDKWADERVTQPDN